MSIDCAKDQVPIYDRSIAAWQCAPHGSLQKASLTQRGRFAGEGLWWIFDCSAPEEQVGICEDGRAGR
jgi:hypothetical protein